MKQGTAIRLSKRLSAVAGFVPEGARPVDVGTDHAYLPVYLVQSGKVPSALAVDVREGPLNRARVHIEEAGLTQKIGVRLSDGLSQIRPADGDVLVMAGMGGLLMLRILSEGDLSGFKVLVLAPQSDLLTVRCGLMDRNLRITKETLVCEDGKYYPVLCAVHGRDRDDDPVRLRYGKELVPAAFPVLLDYLKAEHETLSGAMAQIFVHASGRDAAVSRYEELRKQVLLNEEAQRRIRQECAWNRSAELQ